MLAKSFTSMTFTLWMTSSSVTDELQSWSVAMCSHRYKMAPDASSGGDVYRCSRGSHRSGLGGSTSNSASHLLLKRRLMLGILIFCVAKARSQATRTTDTNSKHNIQAQSHEVKIHIISSHFSFDIFLAVLSSNLGQNLWQIKLYSTYEYMVFLILT